jgi:hypothetical protein
VAKMHSKIMENYRFYRKVLEKQQSSPKVETIQAPQILKNSFHNVTVTNTEGV